MRIRIGMHTMPRCIVKMMSILRVPRHTNKMHMNNKLEWLGSISVRLYTNRNGIIFSILCQHFAKWLRELVWSRDTWGFLEPVLFLLLTCMLVSWCGYVCISYESGFGLYFGMHRICNKFIFKADEKFYMYNVESITIFQ